MEHFLLYSLVLCIVSFLSIYFTRSPEDLNLSSESQQANDIGELHPAAPVKPGAYAFTIKAEDAEEEFFGGMSRPLRFEVPDLPRAVSDNQNPYF